MKVSRQGRMAYYRANAESPVYSELRGLTLKTVGLLEVLADVSNPNARMLRVVFVYGSIAGGHEDSKSDVDLTAVGNVPPVDLAAPLRKARELLGREIKPRVYTRAEFAEKRDNKDYFLTRVLEKPKLFVRGDKNATQ